MSAAGENSLIMDVGQDARDNRELPLVELTGIQFGVLNAEDIMTFSVFKRDHSITGTKDLWDGHLGVYNLPGLQNKCLTCGATTTTECEGHFGHIILPREVYHPLHVRFLKTVLNRVCLVCHRLKEKKEVKRGTQDERTAWMLIKKQLEDDSESIAEVVDGNGLSNMSVEDFFAMSAKEVEDKLAESGFCEAPDNGAPCKYCGANMTSRDRYPKLQVVLSRNPDSPYETIEMRACGKEEKVPRDYWTFVNGNPRGCHNNTRPLLPCEALTILRKLSEKVISKLGMDAAVARPEALILSRLPLPPSGSRITELDIGSCLPRTEKDKQQMHLQRLTAEANKVQTQSIGKPNFASYETEVMKLQVLASNYLTGSKWENGLKYKAYNPVEQVVEKDDKLMRSILAKTNNSSARLVVVGDPSIKIEEILLPVYLVEQLTIPEMVTTFNRNRLQKYIEHGAFAHLYKTGAVFIDRRDGFRADLRKRRQGDRTYGLEIGDLVHRHLKDGDLVIVNRPPSLTKHSMMAMQVRLHLGCSSGINPLICPSFQADFDGDAMHIYVPQSPESLAELHSFMRVSDQLINPQGGQSNNVLAEDSRLGAFLITDSGLFLSKTEMSQFTSSFLSSLPAPAILKAPKVNGPLWTGQQLYSMVLPKGICYRAADKKFSSDMKRGILIKDGELLVCNGHSQWLGSAPDALTAVICKLQGPAVALAYLNQAQELANMYIRDRGFSVGLQDFKLTRDRSLLWRMRLKFVSEGNRDALMQTLLEDQNVQREEVEKNPTRLSGLSAGTECRKSKGLFLGTTGMLKRSEALDKVAIARFQEVFGKNSDRLVRMFCKKSNPLSLMIKAGSKGSVGKLVSQSISLGLQLFKGEHLLPWSAQDLSYQKELIDTSSSRVADLLQFDIGAPLVNLSGYWESRGIVTNSYLDGLTPIQFFTHSISSRYGMLRAKVEEPNMLLKRLLLFLRNLHVGYDGSVRSSEGHRIVQFEYGGLLEMDAQGNALEAVKGPISLCEAGEPVGILAATAITEPAYQMKLDSPHNVGAKAIGPLDLIKESLSSSKALTLVDRRVLLRMPRGIRLRPRQQEKTALNIALLLKPVTLDMVTSVTMIEYRKTSLEVEEDERKSPWLGHIRLNVEKLKVHQVSVTELRARLHSRHSITSYFSSSNRCRFGSPPGSADEPEPCIHFYTKVPRDFLPSMAELEDEEYNDHMFALLEVTKVTLIPMLMSTLVKGDPRIQAVTLLWEDADWNPKCAKIHTKDLCQHESRGEVVVEVTMKSSHCKVRGKAWEIVKDACLPIMHLLDWQRCTPYSIKEINHAFGLEAAKGVLLQRLDLAVASMGKGVNREHLELIADSMVSSGEVNGASLSGYKDLCKANSRSAPFSCAAHENPKNSFVSAARIGARESIEGALISSVWGKAPSLGTGSSFGVLWQAKAEEEPAVKIQDGVDIHECIAKINSVVPPGPCNVNLQYRNGPFSRPTRPMRPSYEGALRPDIDRRGFTKNHAVKMDKGGVRRPASRKDLARTGDKGRLGHKHSQFRTSRIERKTKLNEFTTKKDSSLHTLQAPAPGRSSVTGGQGAVHQDKGAISHAGLDRASDGGSNSLARLSDEKATISTEKLAIEKLTLVSSTTERPDDSSSFHTPNEELDTHDSAHSDSPCSSFRRAEILPPEGKFVEPSPASEGDQMSGVSQPAPLMESILAAPIDDSVVEYTAKNPQQRATSRVEPRGELEGCGSISPMEERLREKFPNRLNAASEDAFCLTPELHDEWKRLENVHRIANQILFHRYKLKDKLNEKDHKWIMKNVLLYHPDSVQKVGCGVDHIKVDYHHRYSNSRCFFVVRTDETICDFSYRKCITGLANTKSPALAMKYDYEYSMKNEREKKRFWDDDGGDEVDPFRPDVPSDLGLAPPWSPLPEPEQGQLTPPPAEETMNIPNDECDESEIQVVGSKSKHEESSCETSELEPEYNQEGVCD